MPKRNIFYSFHFEPDNWRASQVRQMGVLEGNEPARDNDWEEIKSGGDRAIKNWIDGQLKGKSCAVVLVGQNTAGRKWIDYEIEKAWNDGKGVVGIHIHNLKDRNQRQTSKGNNPFETFTMKRDNKKIYSIVKCYNVNSTDSKTVYNTIKSNLANWIEEAIRIRNEY